MTQRRNNFTPGAGGRPRMVVNLIIAVILMCAVGFFGLLIWGGLKNFGFGGGEEDVVVTPPTPEQPVNPPPVDPVTPPVVPTTPTDPAPAKVDTPLPATNPGNPTPVPSTPTPVPGVASTDPVKPANPPTTPQTPVVTSPNGTGNGVAATTPPPTPPATGPGPSPTPPDASVSVTVAAVDKPAAATRDNKELEKFKMKVLDRIDDADSQQYSDEQKQVVRDYVHNLVELQLVDTLVFSRMTELADKETAVARLAARLRTPEVAARLTKSKKASFIILGFADPTGTSALNFRLSKDRADEIRKHVLATLPGVERVVALSVGQTTRLDEAEQKKNRAAEVWLAIPSE